MSTVFVGCKLPHGVVLEHPMDPKKTVTINGKNKSTIIGAGYATTEVDGAFWADWSRVHQEFKPLKSGTIFAAKSHQDLAAMAKEFRERKTGLEPMPQNSGGVVPAVA